MFKRPMAIFLILTGFVCTQTFAVTVYTVEDGLPSNGIRSQYIDSEGNKWFGGKSGGVSKYD
ncbi:unnamed protein product, partial [marine sediment metagenome]